MPVEKTETTDDDFALGDPAGASEGESLAEASARLVRRQPPGAALFRVVEVTRDAQGRVRRHGRIWHPDLALVRRFGRALAANSGALKVEVSDARGRVIETLAPLASESPPAGWSDWRTMPLPPAPTPLLPAPVKRRAPPAVQLPVLSSELDPETEAELTRTL